MKNLLKQALILIIGITAVSCEKETVEPEQPIEWTLSDPAITAPSSTEAIDLDQVETFDITWDAAISSEDTYAVTYKVKVAFGDDVFLNDVATGNNGKETKLVVNSTDLDTFLNLKGVAPGEEDDAIVTVTATALTKTSFDESTFSAIRTADISELVLEEVYISGSATEGGATIESAVKLRRLKDAAREHTNEYEVFTMLKADGDYMFYSSNKSNAFSFGAAEEAGTFEFGGSALSVEQDGIYRIYFNFDTKAYEVEKFESFGLIGDPLLGWGEDVDLDYQGGGIWKANMIFKNDANMIFRANDEWIEIHILKGTTEVMFDSRRDAIGLTKEDTEDVFSPGAGAYIVTLDLSSEGYTFDIEIDPDAGANAPETLFLMSEETMLAEFAAGEVPGIMEMSEIIDLTPGTNYIFNSKSDGSGTNYTFVSTVGEEKGDDQATGVVDIEVGDTPFTVGFFHAYRFKLNFNDNNGEWKYYNLKLFHWDDANGGWDSRAEYVMTYQGNYTYTVSGELTEAYITKFFSPWELVLCAEIGSDGTASSGNFERIYKQEDEVGFLCSETGTYDVTLIINKDLAGGTYEFVKQ